jgi:hypothetical protein
MGWQEKRSEIGQRDLSANLIVQLGLATEDLNRIRYERVFSLMAATLDGMVMETGVV